MNKKRVSIKIISDEKLQQITVCRRMKSELSIEIYAKSVATLVDVAMFQFGSGGHAAAQVLLDLPAETQHQQQDQ